MLYRFTGFCSFNGKQFDKNDRILIEANSDEDAKSEAYIKLKKLCGVKPNGQFAVQRLTVERQYSEQEIQQMNYQAEVDRNREIYLANQTNEDEPVIPFTEVDEDTIEEVVEQPKKSTRKKKTTEAEQVE